MAHDRQDQTPRSDASFAAWLNGLQFSIDRSELEAIRAAYDQLARMNELNRAPVSLRPGMAGTDK